VRGVRVLFGVSRIKRGRASHRVSGGTRGGMCRSLKERRPSYREQTSERTDAMERGVGSREASATFKNGTKETPPKREPTKIAAETEKQNQKNDRGPRKGAMASYIGKGL